MRALKLIVGWTGLLVAYDVAGQSAPGGNAYVPTQIVAGTNVTISPTNGLGKVTINATGGGGSGTVTSVAFADGSTDPIYVITGSPITGAGTLTETLATETANTVFAGPTTGSAAQPTFRALGLSDLPHITGPAVLGVATGSSLAPSALTSIPVAVETFGFDTPNHEGAVGNGVTDDTTAVQTCSTTGACYLPPGYTFLTSSTITVPASGQFLGAGQTSILKASAVSGAVVQATSATDSNIGGFQINGVATIGVEINDFSYFSKLHDIYLAATLNYYGFYFDQSSFCMNLEHLVLNNGNIGLTITFTGSLSGATTGTISSTIHYASGNGGTSGTSASNPANGVYMMVFGNGEVRRITVSGTTVTWTGALAAVSITTGSIGTGIHMGSGQNCTVGNLFVSQNNGNIPFGMVMEDLVSYNLGSSGSTFNSVTLESCQVCLFLGGVTNNIVFNSLYIENGVLPILVGEAAGSFFSTGVFINGANISGPISANPGYANRYAFIDVQAAYGFIVRSANFAIADSTSLTAYPLTFAGGSQTTAPKVYMFANAAGVPRGCAILYPGDYGTGSTPSLTASYTGGNAGSGVTFTITAGLTPFQQQGVIGCTVSGGTGYTAGPGMVPVSINSPNGATSAVIVQDSSWMSYSAGDAWGLPGVQNISAQMAYDSVNASGYNRMGYTLMGDTGFYNQENGTSLMGSTVTHAPETAYREFVQFYGPSGTQGNYIVPMVSFP